MSAIYDQIKAITHYGDRRKAIKALSASEKKAYVRHQAMLRQRKYMSDPKKRAAAYAYVREYRKSITLMYPERIQRDRAQRAAYMRAYRARKKVT
jgi:hypothetical protein